MKHDLEPSALYWASFNRFEMRLSGECISDIARSGPADAPVAYHVNRADSVAWHNATPDAIRAELKECGAWDAEELADDEANRRRILWVAAWNVAEEETPCCDEPLVS